MAPDLTAARAAAEATLLGETCTITRGPRKTADQDFDDVTGTYSGGASQAVYAGPCGVSGRAASSTRGDATGDLPAGEYVLKLPMAVTTVKADDQVVINSSVNDPKLVGREFVTTDEGRMGTLALLRRVGMTEVPSE